MDPYTITHVQTMLHREKINTNAKPEKLESKKHPNIRLWKTSMRTFRNLLKISETIGNANQVLNWYCNLQQKCKNLAKDLYTSLFVKCIQMITFLSMLNVWPQTLGRFPGMCTDRREVGRFPGICTDPGDLYTFAPHDRNLSCGGHRACRFQFATTLPPVRYEPGGTH